MQPFRKYFNCFKGILILIYTFAFLLLPLFHLHTDEIGEVNNSALSLKNIGKSKTPHTKCEICARISNTQQLPAVGYVDIIKLYHSDILALFEPYKLLTSKHTPYSNRAPPLFSPNA